MRGLLALAALLLPTLVSASEFPALYRVTGVAQNDVLNIRAAPSGGDPIVGTFAPDQSGIEVIAVTNDRNWAMVGLPEVTGWVALRYLERLTPDSWTHTAIGLQCSGTEPFWSTRLSDDRQSLEFQFFDDPVNAFVTDWTATPENYTGGTLGLAASGPSGTAFATIRSQLCSDGMSDRAYGLATELFVIRDGTPTGYRGCCSLIKD